ncbi:PREDICTED: histone-lysine N-methyltransferase SETMAR-like [Eufriesea mexicana]|uniref:histone-lysine N-methyltransferase SETMAR-like n=1 Tax=Eufriesea mexicana TaxID=516756 RepID=UPI00083C3FB4|nr:PREDICTED: histone-lysine N-methyltransferase SETMAR-like [Eufriesea mexicana]
MCYGIRASDVKFFTGILTPNASSVPSQAPPIGSVLLQMYCWDVIVNPVSVTAFQSRGYKGENSIHSSVPLRPRGKSGAGGQKNLCCLWTPNIVSNATAKRWFQRFRSGHMNVEDATHSGRPIVENFDKIMEIVESDRHASTYSITQELKISQKTVWNHLHKAGLKKKLDVWVPHELTQKNLLERIDACDSLLKRNEIDPFLKRMVTGDEKWVIYENNGRKRSWSKRGEPAQTIAKPGLTTKKVLLRVSWDWKGILHYELLPSGQSLNSDLYCQQLTRLKQVIDQKRPELANRKGVVFHQDNARLHTSLTTRQKLRELGSEVISHPPYSPDLAPSGYHLLKHLHNFLNGKKLVSRETCENELVKFFTNRDENFFNRGIMKLPLKWTKVIEQNGAYLI